MAVANARLELLAEVLVDVAEVTAVVVSARGVDIVNQRLTVMSMFTFLSMRIERCIAGALSPFYSSVVSVNGYSVCPQLQLPSKCTVAVVKSLSVASKLDEFKCTMSSPDIHGTAPAGVSARRAMSLPQTDRHLWHKSHMHRLVILTHVHTDSRRLVVQRPRCPLHRWCTDARQPLCCASAWNPPPRSQRTGRGYR